VFEEYNKWIGYNIPNKFNFKVIEKKNLSPVYESLRLSDDMVLPSLLRLDSTPVKV
jgi:hypothetical protein